MLVTVCTPTYNRAYCLENAYRSLKNQTNRNFEWIIVDDGSSDGTAELVQGWINEQDVFPITYVYKENGGKHTAINQGVQKASGDVFVILDSDDMLTPDAIEIIIEKFILLPKVGFAGVGFNKLFSNGNLIGTTFAGEYVDASSLERPRYRIGGDKAEVFRTDVLREFPFPVFEGERFLGEALVWNRIAAAGYRLRWYNKGIYLCEYRADGLSMNASGKENFEGYTLSVKELLSYKQASMVEKIRNLGVYAWVANEKKLSLQQAAERVRTSVWLVVAAKFLYEVKRRIKSDKRIKRLRIKQ